jgi:hypothetical protein
MTEIQYPFGASVRGPDGSEYHARVCGHEVAGGLWEGWIEFEPVRGGPVVRTARETTQPNREDFTYWSGGLRETYLEGALERALKPRIGHGSSSEERSGGVGTDADERPDAREGRGAPGRPVMDPFAVYTTGDEVLRRQLSALSAWQLRTIARAYGLAPDPDRLELLGKAQLSELIADAVALRSH